MIDEPWLGRSQRIRWRPLSRLASAGLIPILVVVSIRSVMGDESDGHKVFSKERFVAADGRELLYRLATPPAERGVTDRRFPVVLFLHGAGERGEDNESPLKHGITELARPERRNEFPAFLIVPQCPADQKWVNLDWSQKTQPVVFDESPSPSLSLVLELIDQFSKRPDTDRSRIYVTGLSMGGFGSWYAAGTRPRRFAAMLAICGGGDTTWSERYNRLPIWAVHGDADSAVPVTASRRMIGALANEGHAGELRYTELPGTGHDSWTPTYARSDVWHWLFSQQRPTADAVEPN